MFVQGCSNSNLLVMDAYLIGARDFNLRATFSRTHGNFSHKKVLSRLSHTYGKVICLAKHVLICDKSQRQWFLKSTTVQMSHILTI